MASHGLEYIISLNDKLSAPLKKAVAGFDNLKQKGVGAMKDLAVGLAGTAGVLASINGLIAPALQMDRALGDLGSLGVSADGLNAVRESAQRLSVEIGADSMEIAANAYAVKRALMDLNDTELGQANNALHGLAGALKGSVETATDYAGQMRAIFKNEADKVGTAQFVEQLVGKTAQAGQIFGVSLEEFKAGFGALGNAVSKYGASMESQLAMLGVVSKSAGGGSAAAGQIKQLYENLGKAQKELGLSFVDNNGNLLEMSAIVEKIKGKFKNGMSESQLTRAFGKKGALAMIELLKNTNALTNGMNALSSATDSALSIQQTADASDGFLKMSAALGVIRDTLGRGVLEALYPITDWLAKIIGKVNEWLNEHKTVAKWLSITIATALGLGAVVPILMTIKSVFVLIKVGALAFGGAVGSVGSIILTVLGALKAAVIKLGMALMANPVGAVLTLAALIVGLILYWDEVKAYALKIWAWISEQAAVISEAINRVVEQAKGFFSGLLDTVSIQFKALIDGIKNWFHNLWADVVTRAINAINGLITKANGLLGKIGLEIPLIEIPVSLAPQNGVPNATSGATNPILSNAQSVANFSGAIAPETLRPAQVERLPSTVKTADYQGGKTFTNIADNRKTSVTNHITVNARTDSNPQDIAKVIAERQALAN